MLPRVQKAEGGRRKKIKAAERPKSLVTVKDMLSLDTSKPITQDVEKSHVMAIIMSQPSLTNHSIELKTSGLQLLTLTHIRVANKESQSASERKLRARTNQSKDILQMISGNSSEAISTQTSYIVKSLDAIARENIIKKFDVVIKIFREQVAAMKSFLSIP